MSRTGSQARLRLARIVGQASAVHVAVNESLFPCHHTPWELAWPMKNDS